MTTKYKQYTVTYELDHAQIKLTLVNARTPKEAKRRIKKRLGRKATTIEVHN